MRLLSKALLMIALLMGGAFCLHLFTFSMAGADTDLDYQRQFNERYRIFSLTLPADLTFCGEPVPVGVREHLREFLPDPMVMMEESDGKPWYDLHTPVPSAGSMAM